MDYAFLRQEGLRWLERLSGGQWTDFNEHDPGITILEQLCYALSDLSYRTGHSLPDLLAEGSDAPSFASLPPAEEILSSAPVTAEDLRRIVLDVGGVRNAWVEPVIEGAGAPRLAYDAVTRELRLASEAASAPEPRSRIRGLYQVFVEASALLPDENRFMRRGRRLYQDSLSPAEQRKHIRFHCSLQQRVADRLQHTRGLCEDIAEICVLKQQPVKVLANVEVGELDDPVALAAEIRRTLDEAISPSARFCSLEERLAAGEPVDEIFEGPRLTRGFVAPAASGRVSRRSVLHTSDLLRSIMEIKGVRAVSHLAIASGDTWQQWALAIDPDKAAIFDDRKSQISLRRRGKVLAVDESGAAQSPSAAASRTTSNTLPLPAGRNRNVGHYTSVQHHLPRLYGAGEGGQTASAPSERKARALQLKAYLTIFDQLLANYFAQLANVKELFAFTPSSASTRTYFDQPLQDSRLQLEQVLGQPQDASTKEAPVAAADTSGEPERRQRFLNHLLARFAEQGADYGHIDAAQQSAGGLLEAVACKQRLLQNYAWCSRTRGAGTDLLCLSDAARPGLQARLELMLGLPESCKQILAIEHILLRPITEDRLAGPQEPAAAAGPPLLAAAKSSDPFSMQVTFALADGQGPFAEEETARRFEHALRDETPAHITPYVFWMDARAFSEVQEAHRAWRQALAAYAQTAQSDPSSQDPEHAQHLLGAGEARSRAALELRGTRDRLIDLLGFGETYPLLDTPLLPKWPLILFGERLVLTIRPSQVRVRYTLYEGDAPVYEGDAPGDRVCSVEGNGGEARLVGPKMREDRSFRIFAEKLDRPGRQLFLAQRVIAKVGITVDLPVTHRGLRAHIVDYGDRITVQVERSQIGVMYELIDQDHGSLSAAEQPVPGNGGTILLQTTELREDVLIRVRATQDIPESHRRFCAELETKLPIFVRPNPRVGMTPQESAIVDFGGRATLRLAGAQSSVTYSAYVRSLCDQDFLLEAPRDRSTLTVDVSGAAVRTLAPLRGEPGSAPPGYMLLGAVRGNDAAVSLSLGPLQEDCVVVVQAHKEHAGAQWGVPEVTRSELRLEESALILVRPHEAPELTLQLMPAADNNPDRLLVEGGQPGVLYRFRRPGAWNEISAPAYFHKHDAGNPEQNKGFGQLRIESDLFIARDPQPEGDKSADPPHQPPVPPEVYLGSPLQDPTLEVMAIKVRTGVTWSSSRSIPVTAVKKP